MRTEEQEREYQAAMEQESMPQGEFMREAVFQHTSVIGADRPESRWILSPFDTWETNPHWDGSNPYQPHPEDEYGQEEYYVVGQHAVNLYLWSLDCDEEEQWAEEQYDEDFPF